jgi:hypothetical protein
MSISNIGNNPAISNIQFSGIAPVASQGSDSNGDNDGSGVAKAGGTGGRFASAINQALAQNRFVAEEAIGMQLVLQFRCRNAQASQETFMNKLKVGLVLFFLVSGSIVSGVSMADRDDWRGHVGVGIHFGPVWGYPGYYPQPYYYPAPSYYYPPPVVVAPAQPPVYIEKGDGQDASPGQSNFWYYCADPQGYYPYVRHCSGNWQAVSPQPPSSGDGR